MDQRAELETHRAHAYQEELAERIARAVPEDGAVEPLKGLLLNRFSNPTEPLHGVSKPSFCVIAQGSKQVLLGDSLYRYDPAHYLLATVELPVVGQVVEASAEWPYLSLRLDLDPALVGSVMVEAGHLSSRNIPPRWASSTARISATMIARPRRDHSRRCPDRPVNEGVPGSLLQGGTFLPSPPIPSASVRSVCGGPWLQCSGRVRPTENLNNAPVMRVEPVP